MEQNSVQGSNQIHPIHCKLIQIKIITEIMTQQPAYAAYIKTQGLILSYAMHLAMLLPSLLKVLRALYPKQNTIRLSVLGRKKSNFSTDSRNVSVASIYCALITGYSVRRPRLPRAEGKSRESIFMYFPTCKTSNTSSFNSSLETIFRFTLPFCFNKQMLMHRKMKYDKFFMAPGFLK